MAVSTVFIAATAYVGDDAWLAVWAVFVVGWLVGNLVMDNLEGAWPPSTAPS